MAAVVSEVVSHRPAKRPRHRRPRRGAIVFLVLISLVACLAAAALCIDVAYMQLVQTQLRSSTDAATRAAGQSIARGSSLAEARNAAKEVARLNLVAGQPLLLEDRDIVFGTALVNPDNPSGRFRFTPDETAVNAVRVTGRRTADSPSGVVPLLLAPRVLGTQFFEPTKAATVRIADRDIIVVVDRSGSMTEHEDAGGLPLSLQGEYGSDLVYDNDQDGTLNRMEAMKVSIREFRKVIDATPGVEQLGLVSYDEFSRVESPLSTNYDEFDQRIYEMLRGEGTSIGTGIDAAMNMFSNNSLVRPNAAPVVIVMTDGIHNRGRDPGTATIDAMDVMPRLTMHTVTFSSGADRNRMRQLAETGGGIYAHADDVSNLVSEFERMARSAGIQLVE